MSDFSSLLSKLKIDVRDQALLECALTHRSASKNNNERLEFLGDSILNFTIAAELYNRFPDFPEGNLSRLRSSLVDGNSLAVLAKDLNLGEYLILGSGELKSGGTKRASILADAMEAIFGAVYLDRGVDAAQSLILRLYDSSLNNLPSLDELKDGKTRLQEWLQGKGHGLPSYVLVEASGKPHEQVFKVKCDIPSHDLSVLAEGRSRRKAEQEAALKALTQLEKVE